VGSVSAVTPLLPARMTGDVYLAAHQAGQLPTLEAILRATGVQVHLTSTIDLSHGVTSTFNAIPDLPISEFLLSLDSGPGSALTAKSDLCGQALTLTSSITGQNGKKQDGQSDVGVAGCGVKILAAKASHRTAKVTLRVPAGGKVRLTGKGLAKRTVSINQAGPQVVRLKLTRSGLRSLRKKHKLVVRITAKYLPAAGTSAGGEPVKPSVSRKRVTFRKR
jgi:hypothetical protein